MNFYSILGILPLGMRYWIFLNKFTASLYGWSFGEWGFPFINHRFFWVADPEPQKKKVAGQKSGWCGFYPYLLMEGILRRLTPPVITMKPYGKMGEKMLQASTGAGFLFHQQSVILLNLLRFLGWKVEHRRESSPRFFSFRRGDRGFYSGCWGDFFPEYPKNLWPCELDKK